MQVFLLLFRLFRTFSKDTGFDHIIEFWKTEKDVKVSRNEKISGKQVHTRKQVKKQTGKEKDGQMTEQSGQKTEKQLDAEVENLNNVIFPLPIIFSLFSRLLLRNTFAA